MTSSTAPTCNFSYHAIPAAFLLGFVPHGCGLIRLVVATKNKMSIAMPRTNLDTWKGKLPPDLWNHLVRARGAHLNSMEVFPLFAAAVIAGNVAGVGAEDLNADSLSFLTARTLYTALYIGVKNDVLAYARTGAYAWSIGIPIMALWRAGQAAS
ncbi:hypothetical protein DOTSEDRAFT_163595 [Dothistroma septosporum NZE10]|uniref:MAPEG family protein n=1 Tax=Dothistroma septosporum (strain NZE10 / CBS 128990) TaxID=675120 RepID=N1Q456_DOTSN|nr:hypothetical protein DOTSEDRAFT_163595 [Dothistroma septosporum NZE10]